MAKCYNGAWDSETARRFREENRLMQTIRQKEPEAHCTYFSPGTFVIHVWGREIGPHCETRLGALQSVNLKPEHKETGP